MTVKTIHLLVVDDNASARNLISRYAGNMNAKVVATAANGEDALSMYKLYRPHAVCLDLGISGWDSPEGGLACIRHIIAFDPEAHILALSTPGNRQMGIQAIAAGACAFLNKPAPPKRLFALLHDIVGQARPE